MKKYLFLFIALLAIAAISDAHSQYLRVQDPKSSWRTSQGTIDEAELVIKPAGLYAEFGLYLTFSANGGNYYATDTLEVQYFFNLNENDIVTDSWLWVEDTIVKAMLIDRWTAGLIYEGIVKRRRDPSIFFKNTAIAYEFRIFPLPAKSSRKVKITWLSPINWNGNRPKITIPTDLIRLSYIKPNFKIHVLSNTEWSNLEIPELANYPNCQLVQSENEFGKTMSVTVPSSYSSINYSISFNSMMKDGVMMKYYEENDKEGYYQLAIIPSVACQFSEPRKITFLVDFDANKSRKSISQVIDMLRDQMLNTLTAKDSFNIIFSNINMQPVSKEWLSGDTETIINLFDVLNYNILSSFSNLPLLMLRGIEFIKSKGGDGLLLTISTSDQYGGQQTANQIGEIILDSIRNSNISMYFADYAEDEYTMRYYFANNNYFGNEYLYQSLAKLTGGTYKRVSVYKDQGENLNSVINATAGEIINFEMYSTMKDGFCYSRYSLNADNLNKYISTPIAQIGKYYGQFPLTIQTTGFLRGKAFSKSIEIMPDFNPDKLTKSIWVGAYLRTLEKMPNKSNEINKEIISVSMENRILSLNTAFLALEPWMMPDSNQTKTEDEEGGPSSVDDSDGTSKIKVSVFPNPFSSMVKIKFDLLSSKELNSSSFNIYDLNGKLVKTLNATLLAGNNFELTWFGDDNFGKLLPNGTYILVISTNNGSKVLKLILNR